jgi:hypothetical protein
MVLLWISFSGVLSARAYVLPAEQVLAYMTDRVGPSHGLIVSQKTLVYDPLIEAGMQELAETLYYVPPDRFRSEITGPEVEKITVVGPDGVVMVVDDRILSEKQHLFDHFKDLILYNSAEMLTRQLLRLGVDVDRVSLGRFEDRIVYIIGAGYPDQSVPQVWVDKERFRPVRFILQGGNDQATKEIRYTDYMVGERGADYPGRVLFYEDGKLVRMHVVDRVERHAQVADALFDLSRIREQYRLVESPPPEEPTSGSELDGVRESLEQFRRIFE